jgi:hypothetical protein
MLVGSVLTITLTTSRMRSCQRLSTRSLVLYVCFVDRFCFLLYFFLWPLCCLFFFVLRILSSPFVSSNSYKITCYSIIFSYKSIKISRKWYVITILVWLVKTTSIWYKCRQFIYLVSCLCSESSYISQIYSRTHSFV